MTLVAFLAGVGSPLANAATNTPTPSGPINFAVSPPSVAVVAQPGKPMSVDIRVENQSNVSENIKATVMKFTAEGETGLPNIRKFEPSDDFAKWAQVTPAVFSAEPNEWKTIKLNIDPPKSAAFGYYYAVLFSRADSPPALQKGKNNLQGAFASLILLDVNAPGAIRKVEVADFSTSSHISEFLPTNFNVRMHNTGNTHVGVSGSIAISKHNKMVAQIDVNSSKGYILPKSYRSFTSKWTDGAPSYQIKKDVSGKPVLDGSGVPETTLVWDKTSLSKLRFGKYDARLVMIYNDGHGDVSTSAKLSFWVIPWRIIFGIALVAILIIAGFYTIVLRPARRRLSHKRTYVDRS